MNGLNFNVSLKLDFIENKRLQEPDNIRMLVEEARKIDKDIVGKTKKKKSSSGEKKSTSK